MRHTAIGLNFIDVYHRTGLYPTAAPPFELGLEACGVVEALGADVTGLRVGERVAYASTPLGAYAEARSMPADRVVRVPDAIDDHTAAALMLKGMTAEFLLHRTYAVKKGDVVLVHAAAGGVGLLLCQWARQLGATVIGTVGSEAKAKLAAEHGCHHPVLYTREDVVHRVRELTRGSKCQVVYDSVGQSTFQASMECLAPRGMLVLFGQSSGKVAPFDPALLASHGSLFLTRPTMFAYVATRPELELSAGRVFEAVVSGAVKIRIGQTFALRDAASAHRALEARETTGSTLLLP